MLHLDALTREHARPEVVRRWPRAWGLAVATVCFGAFMGQLDASIVTLTYRPVEKAFHTSPAAVEWVSLAYLLTLIALLVPVGRLSDVRGRKLVYLYGFLLFTAASVACGLAPDLTALIAFRVLQALGAAMLQANSLALVTTSAPAASRRAALGAQGAAQALGLALGPTLGGLLVATVGWRWVYFVNVPVGVVALLSGWYLLPRTHQRAARHAPDGTGIALLGAASTALLLGVSSASGLHVPVWATAGLLAVAAGCGWSFLRHERTSPAPLVDVRLLRDRATAIELFGALGAYLLLFGPLVLVPALLGPTHSALRTGLVLTALPAGFAVSATALNAWLPAGWAGRRRALLGASLALVALAGLLAGPLDPDRLVPALAVLGLGLGFFTPVNNTLIMAHFEGCSAGTGGGLVNMTRGLGTALGVSIVTLCLHVGGLDASGGRAALVALVVVAALVLAATGAGRTPSEVCETTHR